MSTTRSITLFHSATRPCGYLDNQQARDIVVDPNVDIAPALYEELSSRGYRRSGGFVYRPDCELCQACIASRIPVAKFQLNSRRLTRCMKKNVDILTVTQPAEFTDEVFELYQRYINARHSDGLMANPTAEQFHDFLLSGSQNTLFISMYLERQLVGVAVTDRMAQSMSAVYTFFDPDLHKRSLGTYAILQQINAAQQRGLKWLYLGYWIAECQKMNYKADFQPLEIYQNEQWQLQS